jgi:predicted RNA-binding Zn ribbon-like protein
MANESRKGGFFSRFRKEDKSVANKSAIAPQQSETKAASSEKLAVSVPREVTPKPVANVKPEASAEQQEKPVVFEAIDTAAAFSACWKAFGDLGLSQVKTVEMVLTMLSNSIAKMVNEQQAK